MKNFETFLTEKGITKEQFEAKSAVEQLELGNEHREALQKSYEEALASKVTSEELNTVKAEISASNAQLFKAMEALGGAIKAQAEKAGLNAEEMSQTELVKFIEESATRAKSELRNAGFSAKVDANVFLNDVNKAAALMTTANISGVGSTATGTWSPLFGNYVDDRIYRAPYLTSYILNDVTVITNPGTENIYWTERVNEEGDAAWLAEGALKPLIDAEWKTSMTTTKEVAVRWKFTTRFLFHTRKAVEDFQIHARELMEVKVATDVLLGNATTTPASIAGVTSLASAFVVPTAMAGAVYMPNIYDAINTIALQIRALGYEGEIVARLPIAYEALMMSIKDTLGNYIVPPFVSADGRRVGQVRVVFDAKMPAGKILVGVLKNFHVVFAENMIFDEGYENDDFSKNLISRKIESFIGTYIPASMRPSIVYADIAEVLEDIAQPEPEPPVAG